MAERSEKIELEKPLILAPLIYNGNRFGSIQGTKGTGRTKGELKENTGRKDAEPQFAVSQINSGVGSQLEG